MAFPTVINSPYRDSIGTMAEAYLLLPSQKNHVFRWIQQGGFSPEDFHWGDTELGPPNWQYGATAPSGSVSVLQHASSAYRAIFDMRRGPRGLTFSPGRNSSEEWRQAKTWEMMQVAVLKWLGYLKRELAAPDLWAEVYQRRQEIESITAGDAPNTPFTPAEQKLIEERLTEIQGQLLAGHQLQESQSEFLGQQFEWLKRELKTQGRKSWLLMLIGSVLSWSMSRLDPVLAKHILRQLLESLTPIFSHLLQSGTP